MHCHFAWGTSCSGGRGVVDVELVVIEVDEVVVLDVVEEVELVDDVVLVVLEEVVVFDVVVLVDVLVVVLLVVLVVGTWGISVGKGKSVGRTKSEEVGTTSSVGMGRMGGYPQSVCSQLQRNCCCASAHHDPWAPKSPAAQRYPKASEVGNSAPGFNMEH
jgi:hypothetical protein